MFSYSEVAYAVYDLLSRIVSKWILRAVEMGYPKEILLVGGVSSSNIFRQGLQDRLKKRNRNIRVFFASPELSKDNAVGTALLGLQVYQLDYLEKRK
jgi:N6-L-threonylcarbamoyladenine synthase